MARAEDALAGSWSATVASASSAHALLMCDDAVPLSLSTANVRTGMRHRTAALCAVAVMTALGGAFAVAGLADLAATTSRSQSRTPARRLRANLSLDEASDEDDSASARNLRQVCTFDQQWVGTQWTDLTLTEQNSLKLLGWVGTVWDATWGSGVAGMTTTTSTPPPTTTLFGQIPTTLTTTSYYPVSEQTCWHGLTEPERDGANSLGYSITRWTECKKEGCLWPKEIPTDSATCLAKMKYLERKFNETRAWLNFTQMKRDNLVLLGWDPQGKAWTKGEKGQAYGMPWSELSVRERDAAQFLGYDAMVWETCEKATDSSCLQRLEHLETKQRTWIWEQLSPGTQGQLSALGWASRTWFEGETPAVLKVSWTGITNMQKSAARKLGYTQDTFKGCPDAVCRERFEYVQKRWGSIGWMQMKLSERRAWMLLGHSDSLWGNNNNPATMQKRWAELSPEQQSGAMFLGHSEETWQGCNSDWVGRNTSSMNATYVDPSGAVRARMIIDRPYSEISGNIYGKQVASMPTSFIRVFENAVSRALFCGNPPLSFDANTYLDADGEPLCIQKTNYEKEKYRVRVLNVVQGILVDFFIVANVTESQTTARLLFESLQRQVDARFSSPLSHDKYFGRFAKAATVSETRISSLTWNEMQNALNFESKRNYYDEGRACLLHMDAKLGTTDCGPSAAQGRPRSFLTLDLAGPLLALLAFGFTLM